MLYHVHCFIDGAYLRRLATDASAQYVNPRALAKSIVLSREVQDWGSNPESLTSSTLTRVIYYDARPDNESQVSQDLRDYWDVIEVLDDTELGFGSLRGGTSSKKKPPRQKGVDTRIAVDMLVGAFTKLFSVAVLVSGDADFVPVVNEVRRRGVMVVVAAADGLADELRRAADRYYRIGPGIVFPPLTANGKTWPQ